ncbi:hypothetical protein, conserved [Leishmania tarentolae]|uniref:Uncharacterized protein n=1 Tax=Leishmania tarentolae TaxID=5689 RepID=A0A640KVH8_LEITA|nr:hypothetical protein, conserved [Leishmania tarentolae]
MDVSHTHTQRERERHARSCLSRRERGADVESIEHQGDTVSKPKKKKKRYPRPVCLPAGTFFFRSSSVGGCTRVVAAFVLPSALSEVFPTYAHTAYTPDFLLLLLFLCFRFGVKHRIWGGTKSLTPYDTTPYRTYSAVVVGALSLSPDAPEECTMLGLSVTTLFQAYCVGAALFEVPRIVRLLSGDMPLPKVGAWVDDKDDYIDNKPLMYVFVAILTCLVVSRGMACILPKSRIIIAYQVVVHTLEAGLYFYCCSHKEDAPSSEVYITGALMVMSITLFAARLVQLKAQQARVKVSDLKWRQEQLAIIRKKRADYAKSREDKKSK